MMLLIHIREYDGGYPTKKGIALTAQQWKRLFANMKDIDLDVQDVQQRLGTLEDSFTSNNSFGGASRYQAGSSTYGSRRGGMRSYQNNRYY